MCGEKGFKAVQETVRKVKFIGKGFSICFYSSAYVPLRYSTTAYKVLYSSRICMVSTCRTTTEQSYKFPVCVNVSVLFSLDILSQACEKHIETRFSL